MKRFSTLRRFTFPPQPPLQEAGEASAAKIPAPWAHKARNAAEPAGKPLAPRSARLTAAPPALRTIARFSGSRSKAGNPHRRSSSSTLAGGQVSSTSTSSWPPRKRPTRSDYSSRAQKGAPAHPRAWEGPELRSGGARSPHASAETVWTAYRTTEAVTFAFGSQCEKE